MTPADETPPVPFEGLRRHARALGGGLVLLAVIFFLVPDLTPPPTAAPPVELVHGRIVELLPPSQDVTQPDVRIRAVDGPHKGEILEGHLQGPSGTQDLPRYVVGDEVVVNISTDPDAPFIAVADLYRVPVLGLLLGVFAAAVTIVGGWRGVRSLIALALTLAVVVKLVIPLILAGWEPVWVAIVAATGVTIATFLLTEGARRQTIAAAAGTFVALVARRGPGGRLRRARTVHGTARFRGRHVPAGRRPHRHRHRRTVPRGHHLRRPGHPRRRDRHPGGDGPGALRFGSAHRPAGLGSRAMNVGRSHIAATVNTLVLAYVGASLPLIVLFAAGRQDPLADGLGRDRGGRGRPCARRQHRDRRRGPGHHGHRRRARGRRLPFMREEPGVRHAPGWD